MRLWGMSAIENIRKRLFIFLITLYITLWGIWNEIRERIIWEMYYMSTCTEVRQMHMYMYMYRVHHAGCFLPPLHGATSDLQ